MATRLSLVFLILLGALGRADAAALQGKVVDEDGDPVADAVILASPLHGAPPAAAPAAANMDQAGRRFVPHVLPIYKGSAVNFPNSDNIRHHVYSFSPGNRFEIKLYSGAPSAPIVFEHPGVVALGCNIHDWMVGYIYVSDTPYFAKSDADGRWSLNLPANAYRLTLWHPDWDVKTALPDKTVDIREGQSPQIDYSIALKSYRRSGEPPDSAQEQMY